MLSQRLQSSVISRSLLWVEGEALGRSVAQWIVANSFKAR